MRKLITVNQLKQRRRKEREDAAAIVQIENIESVGFVPNIIGAPKAVFKVNGAKIDNDNLDINTGDAWIVSLDAASIDTTTADRRLGDADGLEAGETYTVTFTISGFVAGGARIEVGDALGDARTADGTFTQAGLESGAGTDIVIRNSAATTELTVSNIIVTKTS